MAEVKSWKCPKCGRKFERKGQQHSCTIYPVEKHLKGKEFGTGLYNELKNKIKKASGPFTIESLPCCIHFLSNFTFAGVYVMKNRIRLHLMLNCKISSKRIRRYSKISVNNYMYEVDVMDKKELDKELIGWLKEAYNAKKK